MGGEVAQGDDQRNAGDGHGVPSSLVADATRDTDPGVWRRYAQLLIDGTRPSAQTEPLSPAPLPFGDTAAALSPAERSSRT